MHSKQLVEGTCFDSLFHTESARSMSLSQYVELVKSNQTAALTARLRTLLVAGKGEEAAACKKKLPLFVVGGVMQGGRRLEHLLRYSGCICFDIDDCPLPPEEVIRKAQAIPYMKAGHISPSGKGVKLFICVDSDLRRHALAFELVRRLLEADIPGIRVDISGKDANRGCFAGHDPAAFYVERSVVLSIPEPFAGEVGGDSLLRYVERFEAENPFLPGSRHTCLVRLSAALNSAGFPLQEVVTCCVRRYATEGFTASEVEKTVADIYGRYASSHGSNCLQPDRGGEKRSERSKISYGCLEKTEREEMDAESVEIEPDKTLLPYFEEEVYGRLPPLLTDILGRTTCREERDVMLLGAITLLSSIMTDVCGSMAEKNYYACLYSSILGPSGSGKGSIAALHRLVAPWQQYVFDCSREEVKAYERKRREYELQRQVAKEQMRKNKQEEQPLPDEPEEVRQINLSAFGYVSLARLVQMLQDNDPFITCMFETEMESLIQTMGQDFGNYGYLLNQAAHHERAGSDSKSGGFAMTARPKLTLLLSGTDGMFKKLVPSTENGTFSRLLIYKLTGNSDYRPLTDADDTPEAANRFEALGMRVLEIARHLAGSPTWVKFSDAQRKRLDRYFRREYNQVRAFDNEDLSSAVLRYRLATFRIAMVLTGLRKGEMRSTERVWVISEEDFNTAFAITRVCLQHAYVVSTSLERRKERTRYKFPYYQQKLFADMPESFKWAELMAEANVRELKRTSVHRMLKKSESLGLIVSLGAGYYQKTTEGKSVTSPDVP